MPSGQFARRKLWTGGDMDSKGVDEEFRNLRLTLGNLDKGVTPWSHFALTDTTNIPGYSAVAQRAPFMFDYFDRSDRLLQGDKTPSGQTWVLSGAGASAASISNGMYINTDNTYADLDYGQKITRIAGSFSFLRSTGADDPTTESMSMHMDQDKIGLNTMLHLQFSPQAWELVQYISGGTTPILSGIMDCQRDGTVYGFAYEVVGNTVTVIPPMGPVVSYTNATIGSTLYRYGTWQITQNGTSSGGGSYSRWHGVNLGYNVGQSNRAIGGGGAGTQIDFVGIQNNTIGRSGFKGETIFSTNPGVVAAAATTNWANYQTLSLLAGDYLVYGGIEMQGNGSTTTGFQTAISLFSAGTTTDHVTGYNNIVFNQAISNEIYTPMISAFHVLLASTTTVYLKMRWNYSAGAPQGINGLIWAHRIR